MILYDHYLMVGCAASLGVAVLNLTQRRMLPVNRYGAALCFAGSALLFLLIFRRMGLGYAAMP